MKHKKQNKKLNKSRSSSQVWTVYSVIFSPKERISCIVCYCPPPITLFGDLFENCKNIIKEVFSQGSISIHNFHKESQANYTSLILFSYEDEDNVCVNKEDYQLHCSQVSDVSESVFSLWPPGGETSSKQANSYTANATYYSLIKLAKVSTNSSLFKHLTAEEQQFCHWEVLFLST